MTSGMERDGFEIIPGLIPAETIHSVADVMAECRTRRKGAGARNVLRIPLVRSLAGNTSLLGVAQRVLGESAVPFRATLFDKSVGSNWLVVWHQDTAVPLREKQDLPGWGPWSVKEGVICARAPAQILEQVLAIRVHLDDSTESNGPLRVLPGTHIMGVLKDNQIDQLSSSIPAVECHVGKGGILLMRPLLLHSSSKVKGGPPRRVLHIEYASSLLYEDGLELAAD